MTLVRRRGTDRKSGARSILPPAVRQEQCHLLPSIGADEARVFPSYDRPWTAKLPKLEMTSIIIQLQELAHKAGIAVMFKEARGNGFFRATLAGL